MDDTYGDGMCCAYGNGSWTISVGGVDVASEARSPPARLRPWSLADLGVAALSMEAVIAQGSTTIEGTVANNGTEPVSGFMLAYAVDGGTRSSRPSRRPWLLVLRTTSPSARLGRPRWVRTAST